MITPELDEKLTRYEKLRKERRFVRAAVDVPIFANMLTEGIDDRITVEGLPKDAVFIGVEREVTMQAFLFVYAHESFDKVPEGEYPKNLTLTLTRHYRKPSEDEK